MEEQEEKSRRRSTLPVNLRFVCCNRIMLKRHLPKVIGDKSLPGNPLFLAVPSNTSRKKTHPDWPLVDEYKRAKAMGVPLAKANPDRTVIVLFYDQKTPENLRRLLVSRGFMKAPKRQELSSPVPETAQPAGAR
jgi:hypothetical protein